MTCIEQIGDCKQDLSTMEAALEADDPQARILMEREAQPLATLREVIAEAEAIIEQL